MSLPNEVITGLIGALSALSVVILKDIILSTLKQRHASKRSLLQARVEQAYSPLDYLAFKLLHTDDPETKAATREEIGTVLKNHGHLVSPWTASSFYTLLDDENAGAYLLKGHFQEELNQLKEEYYRKHYSRRPSRLKQLSRIGQPTER